MILKRDALRAVQPAIVDDISRYYLHAVQVETDGSIVATDGHILLRAIDGSPFADADFPVKDVAPYKGNPTTAVVIDGAIVDKVIKAMPKKSSISILQAAQLTMNGDGQPVISATDLQVPIVVPLDQAEVKDRFPKWQRVMPPEDRSALSLTLSVDVLEAVIKSAKAVYGGKATHGGLIEFQIPTEPQHQGKRPITSHEYTESPDHCSGVDCPCATCGKPQNDHREPDGAIIDTVRVKMSRTDIKVDGVVMPCRK